MYINLSNDQFTIIKSTNSCSLLLIKHQFSYSVSYLKRSSDFSSRLIFLVGSCYLKLFYKYFN